MRALPLAALALALASPAPASGRAALEELQSAFEETAQKALPAVVNIRTTQETKVQPPHQFFFGDREDLFDFFHGRRGERDPRDYRYRSEGVGSGVIVTADGLVLTNEHVVRDVDQIEVTLTAPSGGKTALPGKVVGTDRGLDLAVVRIDAPGPFPFLRLAESSKAKVGQWVLAIGSPFELEQTVTAGIVSAVRQSLMIEGRQYNNIIQTDAAINRGNSGGPLLDLDAQVLGINTAIYSPSGGSAGIGFAIPADEIRSVLPDLEAGRRIRRGWIGIQVVLVDDTLAKRFRLPGKKGALVNTVFQGSPADRAGLKRGDVLVEFAGRPVESPEDLVRFASKTSPDETAQVSFYRKGERRSLQIRLSDRPEWSEAGGKAPGPDQEEPSSEGRPSEPKARASEWEGVTVEAAEGGVAVTRVSRDSKLGDYLQEGDLLQGIDQAPVRSLSDFDKAVKAADLRAGIVFDVVRDGQALFISARQP